MLTELSLHILDIANNSLRAQASLVEIIIKEDDVLDMLSISITDNGCGMSEEQVKAVIDPFFTTRTTRNVGFGVSFFKMAAELCDGKFDIKSELSRGTTLTATFVRSHVNRMPLGDMAVTYCTLMGNEENADIVYTHAYKEKCFTADTREFKDILGDVPLNNPSVSVFIRDYVNDNLKELYA